MDCPRFFTNSACLVEDEALAVCGLPPAFFPMLFYSFVFMYAFCGGHIAFLGGFCVFLMRNDIISHLIQ